MKIISKRLFSTLLTVALIFGSSTIIAPLTVQAQTSSELATYISSFNHGGSGSLSATVNGSSITVTGNVTGAKNQLELNMPVNSRLDWKASYSGTANSLLKLSGLGIFSIETEASIINNGTGLAITVAGGGPSVTVNGGTVSAATGIAIFATDSNSKITVESGVVNSSNVAAIVTNGADSAIIVRGGTVSVTNGLAISANGINSSVRIDGGTVSATAGAAIVSNGATITITINGGMVSAAAQAAITVTGADATLSINGGFVFAYGSAITGDNNVINMSTSGKPAIGGNAVVSAWDRSSETSSYTAGDKTDLSVSPSSATATWDKVGSQNGISYTNGTNTGFFPLDDVVVSAGSGLTVTFNSNGGSSVSSQSVTPGGKVIKPGDPSKTGSTFSGWYTDTGFTVAYNFDNNVTVDLILYAKWTVTGVTGSPSMSNFIKIRTYASGMFTDVNEGAWYGYNQQKSIANAYEYGLMQGSGAAIFNPTGNITVAEAITVAARVNRIYSAGADDLVSSGSPWYKVYVDYAIGNGIITTGTFQDYNRAATRAEMAYIFSGALPETEFKWQNTVNSLPDVNSVTSYSDAIFMLYKAGVLAGNDEQGTFSPGNSIIRAEAAAIISRVILPSMRMSGNVF